jgi:hypothetical protein
MALAMLSFLNAARADETAPEKPSGRIPWVQIGPSFAMAHVPFTVIQQEFDGSTHPANESTDFIGLGLEAKLRIDLDVLLVYGDGLYNFLPSGLGWDARGGVIIGARTTSQLTEFVGSSTSGNVETDTYRVHLNKEMPVIIGLVVGANVYNLRENVLPAEGLTGEGRNPSTNLASIEAGFGMVGGQFEIFVAPAYEFINGQLAGRWSLQYAYPIGRIPLYLRLGGDHFFGSGTPVNYIIGTSIGIGSSLGVSTWSD